MKVEFTLSIGISNAKHRDVIEVEDDTTEDELDQMWQEWSSNFIDGGARILDKDDKP